MAPWMASSMGQEIRPALTLLDEALSQWPWPKPVGQGLSRGGIVVTRQIIVGGELTISALFP